MIDPRSLMYMIWLFCVKLLAFAPFIYSEFCTLEGKASGGMVYDIWDYNDRFLMMEAYERR